MPINLKPPSAKDFLPSSNPIQSFQNPVQDFLRPMQETNDELKRKISEITSGNIPDLPKQAHFQQIEGAGNQVGGQGTTLEQPTINPVSPDSLYNPTESLPYKALAPLEPLFQAGKKGWENAVETAPKIKEAFGSIAERVGNPTVMGTEELSAKIAKLIKDNPDITDDEVKAVIQNLKDKHNYVFSDNPMDNPWIANPAGALTNTLLAGAANTIGMVAGGAPETVGNLSLGAGKMVAGDTEGASQVAKGATEGVIAGLNIVAPVASTAFNSPAAQTIAEPVFEPIAKGSEYLTEKALEQAGIQPGTPEYQNWLEAGSTAGQLAGGAALFKGAGKAVPYVKTGAGYVGEKAGPFAEAGIAKAKEIIPKAVKAVTPMNLIPKVKEMFSETISGVPKSEQVGMQSNPYQMKEFNDMVARSKSGEGIDDINNYKTEQYGKVTDEVTKKLDKIQNEFGEDGKVYNDIKSLPTQVPVAPIISAIESHPMLAMGENGTIVRKPGVESGTITDADIAHINRIYGDLKASAQEGNLNVPQILKARSTASKYARYDKMDVNTLSSDGAKVMRDIRGAIDTQAKATIPGLKELDAHYVDKLTEMNESLRDLIYKGGDVKGDYRSNLGSIVSNLANPSRANLLARLEKVIPGIGSKVEAINNLSRLHKAMVDKGVFQKYSGAGGAVTGFTLGGTVFPVVGHILGGITGGITGMFIDGAVTRAKVGILRDILSKETPGKQAEIARIVKEVKKGQKMDAEGKKIVEDIKKKVMDAKVEDIVNPK